MNNKLNLEEISKHLVFLHGPSGGGKSVLQASIEGGLSEKYYVIYLASGDCFRALQDLNPQMAREMRAGKFIGTLDATMPKLEATINSFFSMLFSKSIKPPVLVLDGFLRIGEYQREGKTIPSQIDQVASAFSRVAERWIDNDRSVADENLLALMEEQHGVGGEGRHSTLSFFSHMIRGANHYYLDVRPSDAESLMRIRSEGNLGSVIKKIEGRRGKLGQLARLLNEAKLIQKGSFKSKTKGSRVVELSADIRNDHRLRPIPKRHTANLDTKMNKIINEVESLVKWEKDEEPTFSGAIKKVLKQKGVEMEGIVIPRDDDLTHKSRWKRINEFNDLTIEGVLKSELGFKETDGVLTPTMQERRATIINGPSCGITLDDLRIGCQDAVGKLMKDITPHSKEGSVFGRERA